MKKLRIAYAAAFGALLLVEIFIALFVRDRFIRPYVGDVLVTVLLGCLCRVLFPKGIKALPALVFLFAAAVEITQYFDLVALLGWENNQLLSTLMGRTFSFPDILCYAAGCLIFYCIDLIIQKHRS